MAAVAFRTALSRLGFTVNAALAITDQQGIEYTELRHLTDSEADGLCKIVRKPGGVIQHGGVGNAVPNIGEAVSVQAQNNLKLACYFIRHRVRTSRMVTVQDLTIPNIRVLREQREAEKAHVDSTELPKMNSKDWPKTMDAIRNYLRGFLGITKVPLAYVVRETKYLIPKPEAEDPATEYGSKEDELIARAPIINGNVGTEARGPFVQSFITDRNKVWDLIAQLSNDHESWTYIKEAQRTRNGRLAFLNMWSHYLGPSNVDIMANDAERKLATANYVGEKRRWNFEKYVSLHKDQHTVLKGLMEYGYVGIDERSKVRHLIDGIKTEKLDTIKATILARQELRTDFDGCVNLYKDFIAQLPKPVSELNIAMVDGSSKPTKQPPKSEGKPVQDRYYNKEEYAALSTKARADLYELRKKRGGDKNKRKYADKMTKLSRTVAGLKAAAKQGTAYESDVDSSDKEKQTEPDKSNRTHPALTRQATKKKAKT